MKKRHAQIGAAATGTFCISVVVGGMTALGLPAPGIIMFGMLFTPLSYEAAITFYSIHKPKESDHV